MTTYQESQKFYFRLGVGFRDAIICLLQPAFSDLDKTASGNTQSHSVSGDVYGF